jgi:hypothetical protein
MIEIKDTNVHGEEDRRLDLLVDGELPEDDRRSLLGQLDHEPDGWRRCALAFLEAQTWKQAFGAIARPSVEPIAKPQPASDKGWGRYGSTFLAVAGSILFALALGIHMRSTGSLTTTTMNAPAMPVRQGPGAANPWQMVTLTAFGDRDGAPQSFQLPAAEGNRIDEAWLQSIPSPVSPEMLQALQQSGHEIRQRRQLLPVEMQDGRRLVVPVDEVEIRNVGRPPL